MTKNEQLRELLAEARDVVAGVAFVAGPYAPLLTRIDAALAEQQLPDGPLSKQLRPDVECAPWVIGAVKKLEGERNEARAEVERLKASYDVVCRERNKIQVRFSILSKRWINYRSVELLRQVEWVTDGRESTTSCLFCHRSHTQGHAVDCDAFGRIGGAVPPDVVEYASYTEEEYND